MLHQAFVSAGNSTGSVLINIFNEAQSSLATSANFGFCSAQGMMRIRDREREQ